MATFATLSLAAAMPARAGNFTLTPIAIYPIGIDNTDRVVGSTGQPAQGAIWANGTITRVPGTTGFSALNSSGIAVGWFENKNTKVNLLTYDVASNSLTAIPLPKDDGFEQAPAMNDAGTIVITLRTKKGPVDGFEISNNAYTEIHLRHSITDQVYGINDSGVVSGGYGKLGLGHSFIWLNGKFTSFHPPGAKDDWASGTTNDGITWGYIPKGRGKGSSYILNAGSFTTVHFPGAQQTVIAGIGPGGGVIGTAFTKKGQLTTPFVLIGQTYYPINAVAGATVVAVNSLGSFIAYSKSNGGYIAQCPQAQQPCTQ